MPALIPQIIPFANGLLANALAPGDPAMDAAAGNGNDILHLARLVGPGGLVHAFDIQELALNNTHLRLRRHGLSEWPK